MKQNLFLLLFFFLTLVSKSNVEIYFKANDLYNTEKYDEAVQQYELLIKEYKILNDELFNNLGCSYFKLTDYQNAILNFERAKRLNPNNKIILKNIELTNQQLEDKFDYIPEMFYRRWLNMLYKGLSPDGWAFVFIILFSMSFLGLIIYFVANKIDWQKIGLFSAFALFPLAVLTLFITIGSYQKATGKNEAIVFSDRISIKVSPTDKSADIVMLHAGTKVYIKDQVGTWVLVKLSDGKEGWLKQENMEVI
jgi:tetratricopeptide (TPR) repeat protein